MKKSVVQPYMQMLKQNKQKTVLLEGCALKMHPPSSPPPMVFGQNEIKNISQLFCVACAKLTHLHVSIYAPMGMIVLELS